ERRGCAPRRLTAGSEARGVIIGRAREQTPALSGFLLYHRVSGGMAMAYQQTLAGAQQVHPPTIRTIGMADLKDALRKGVDDFQAMPSHAVFLSLIYPIVGLILVQLAIGGAVMPLVFPIVAGFALIGP